MIVPNWDGNFSRELTVLFLPPNLTSPHQFGGPPSPALSGRAFFKPSVFACWDILDHIRYGVLIALVVDCATPIYVDRRVLKLGLEIKLMIKSRMRSVGTLTK
jgi:hypothetical protein